MVRKIEGSIKATPDSDRGPKGRTTAGARYSSKGSPLKSGTTSFTGVVVPPNLATSSDSGSGYAFGNRLSK